MEIPRGNPQFPHCHSCQRIQLELILKRDPKLLSSSSSFGVSTVHMYPLCYRHSLSSYIRIVCRHFMSKSAAINAIMEIPMEIPRGSPLLKLIKCLQKDKAVTSEGPSLRARFPNHKTCLYCDPMLIQRWL